VKEHTFEAVFNQWVEFRRLSLKEGRQSTLSQILRMFSKDVLPTLGERSIYDINRHDLLDLLSRIEQRKALTTAEKCRIWFNQLFRYALVKIEGLDPGRQPRLLQRQGRRQCLGWRLGQQNRVRAALGKIRRQDLLRRPAKTHRRKRLDAGQWYQWLSLGQR
jgi:integrase